MEPLGLLGLLVQQTLSMELLTETINFLLWVTREQLSLHLMEPHGPQFQGVVTILR